MLKCSYKGEFYMIIAIDGTSSSGKTSIARELGNLLNIPVLGTGAIYRAVALKLYNASVEPNDDEKIKQILSTTSITTKYDNGKCIIFLDGLEEPDFILHSPHISVYTPTIAVNPIVREFVRSIQHQEAEIHESLIVEGRDIGSVVFPDANFKFFIDADIKARAQRRLNDYTDQGKVFSLEDVIKEIEHRDDQDRNREISPLLMTSDAHLIDSSSCSAKACALEIANIIKR